MIDRELIVEMFDNMHEHGVDTDQELLWGYFFIATDLTKLEAAAQGLVSSGYRFVDIHETGPDEEEGEEDVYFLHMEKVERHTVDSLDKRNQELARYAEEHGLDAYDGMDVGRPDGKPFGEIQE